MLKRPTWLSCQQPASNWVIKALSPRTIKEQNPVNNHVNLEADPSPDKLSDETKALFNTLISVLRDSEAEDPVEPYLDSWHMKTMR